MPSLVAALLMSFGVCPPPAVSVELTSEQDALLTIVRELTELEQLIAAAELSADPDARIQFRYDWLRRDLARVRHGVRQHIDPSLANPRRDAAIRADYRR